MKEYALMKIHFIFHMQVIRL